MCRPLCSRLYIRCFYLTLVALLFLPTTHLRPVELDQVHELAAKGQTPAQIQKAVQKAVPKIHSPGLVKLASHLSGTDRCETLLHKGPALTFWRVLGRRSGGGGIPGDLAKTSQNEACIPIPMRICLKICWSNFFIRKGK